MEPTRMDPRRLVEAKARAARVAAGALAMTPTKTKNDALTQMARGLEEKTAALLEANRADLDRARAQGVTRAFLDRLTLTDSRIDEMAAGLLELSDLVDLIIPRGGEEFVRWVGEHSRVPVLKHDRGLVHVFVDADADLEMAAAIVMNAKVQRPSVCNAMETLLVHATAAPRFLPLVGARLADAGVELRGCPRPVALLPRAKPATTRDWHEEYLDLI